MYVFIVHTDIIIVKLMDSKKDEIQTQRAQHEHAKDYGFGSKILVCENITLINNIIAEIAAID